jgi:hypothetical protein
MTQEESEGCNKFHNEELRDTFSSANIYRIIRSRRKKGAGDMARVEKTKMY